MARPSLSQRRAEHIVERSGGGRIRRGDADRLEVGSDGLYERTEGSRVLRVGGTLSESTAGTHATRAKRVERTVRGRARVNGRADTVLLGGGMSEVHAGAEVVLAGMSDDLVIGAGTRVTALLDLWVAGLLGIEEKLATSNFDGAFVDTARTLFEREYGTGVHHAGSATFSGTVYATQATGFRKLMKVSSGVRNLSSGGGGGGGDEGNSGSGPSSATPSPGAGSGPGLLGSAQSPRPGAAAFDSTDLARLAGEAESSEDAAHYARAENVSDTATNLQEAARGQVAGDSPEEAARAPSRMDSADGPSAGSSPGRVDAADPAPIQPESAAPTQSSAWPEGPGWTPSPTHEQTYTKGQVPVGDSFGEFRFDAVVGARPDTLLSDDAQAALDTGAFRHMYEAKGDVTDMARESVRLADLQRPADMRLPPDAVSQMNAVDAHNYLVRLQNSAVQAGDAEEARRLDDIISNLDHYAFDRYTAAIADAEAVHAMTPAKLPFNIDAKVLAERLNALGEEHFARMNAEGLSDAERHEASKLASAYYLAAQDAAQGLDPLVHVQETIDSGLGQADAAVYAEAASGISAAMSGAPVAGVHPVAARSLWARAGEIASGLFAALRRWDSRPGNAISHVDTVPETPGPIRFLDSSPRPRVPDLDPTPGVSTHSLGAAPPPAAGKTGRASAGSGSPSTLRPTGTRSPPPGETPRLNPTLDGDGAHWKEPTSSSGDLGTGPWTDPP